MEFLFFAPCKTVACDRANYAFTVIAYEPLYLSIRNLVGKEIIDTYVHLVWTCYRLQIWITSATLTVSGNLQIQ